MKVSNRQLEELGQIHFRKFTEDMVAHVATWFPEHLAASGEAAVRETIAHCIRRAGQYRFITTRNICLYLNAMFAWGSFFDTDPQCAWAQQLLNDRSFPNSTTRINALSEASEKAWLQIQGEDEALLKACFKTLVSDGERIYDQLIHAEPGDLARLLHELHPQKAAAIGATGIRELSARSRVALNSARLSHLQLENLVALLMFLFGAGVMQDPQFPWLEAAIRNRTASGEELQRQIWGAAIDHLNRFLLPPQTTIE